jgi:DNA-binding CsgD family transcriptional regulator/tetratricopeptide (TPR) repeat protein
LRAQLERARGGEPCLALVWGEAGVGKTRLLAEFATHARECGARVVRSACFESACPPFAPLQQTLERLGASATLGVGGPRWPSLAVAEAAKYRRFLSAQGGLLDAAAAGPVVALIDDLQWADLATLEALAFLARNLGDAPIVVLAAVRSDDIERDSSRLEPIVRLRREATAVVDLQPLTDAEMERLVVSLLPQEEALPAGEIERICSLAEGKPYFAEELVNSALAREHGGESETPLSIRAGVLSRYGRLAPDEQRLICYAAVVGYRFDAGDVAALAGQAVETVWRALATARDLQIVRERDGTPNRFAFRHAITREVIYRELRAGEAQRLHRAIAERLEAQTTSDASELAYHWAAAGDVERSVDADERAGDLASERNAYRDAAVSYRRALDALPQHGPRFANLCEKLSRALSIDGRLMDSRTWGQRAVEAFVGAGHPQQGAALALKLARRYYEAGEPERAIAATNDALAWLADGDDAAAHALRFDAYVSLAHFAALQGRGEEAAGHLARAESETGGVPLGSRHAFHLVRAMVRSTQGLLARAFEDYEEALHIARALGDEERLIWTLNNYGSRALVTGRGTAAVDAYREALDLAEHCGFSKMTTLVGFGLALAHVFAGDLAAARSAQGRARQPHAGSVHAQVIAAAVGVRIAYLAGEHETAARYADPAELDTAFRSGETQNIGLLAGAVAAFLEDAGRRADASALRARALAQLDSADWSLWLVDRSATSDDAGEVRRARELLEHAARDPQHAAAGAHLLLFEARVLRRTGKRRAAVALATEAARLFEEIGRPWERAQALEVTGRRADALEIYRGLGYAREVERVARERRRVRHRPHARHLTPRESEVAQLATQGLSNRRIAERLGIGERTVETHIAALFDRFDLTSRAELQRLLERNAAERADVQP